MKSSLMADVGPTCELTISPYARELAQCSHRMWCYASGPANDRRNDVYTRIV